MEPDPSHSLKNFKYISYFYFLFIYIFVKTKRIFKRGQKYQNNFFNSFKRIICRLLFDFMFYPNLFYVYYTISNVFDTSLIEKSWETTLYFYYQKNLKHIYIAH